MVLGVPYSRVSSAEQASGLGLDRQASDPGAYCDRRGWALYEGPGYTDAGVSAFGGKNIHDGELGRFLADAKAGRFGAEPIALLIEDLDRFSRAMPLAVLPVLIDDLLNAGMTISIMSKGRDISRESINDNQMELHELLFSLNSAHDFSQRLSRRISHVHQINRERLRNGEPVTPSNAPAWIDLNDAGEWVLNDYAAVIRRVVSMAVDDFGCLAIARALNNEGIPSPGQYRRHQWAANAKRRSNDVYKSVRWSSASVKQVLSQPALIGDRQIVTPGYKQKIREWQNKCARLRREGIKATDLPKHPLRTYETPQKNYYPALITEAEQAAILTAMRRRKPAANGRVDQLRWVASGLSFCKCGEPVGATCSKRRNGKVYYLKCRGRVNGTGCKQPSVRLEEAQASLLTRMTTDSLVLMTDRDSGANKASELAIALAAMATAQANVDQIRDSLDAGDKVLANETDSDILRVLAKRQANQEEKMEIAQRALTSAQGHLHLLQTHPETKELTLAAQKQIKALFKKFQSNQDTADDRHMVQRHLSRMGIRTHVDGNNKLLGLQIANSEIDWQPLDNGAAAVAIAQDEPFGWKYVDLNGSILTTERNIAAIKTVKKDEVTTSDGKSIPWYELQMAKDTSDPKQNTKYKQKPDFNQID